MQARAFHPDRPGGGSPLPSCLVARVVWLLAMTLFSFSKAKGGVEGGDGVGTAGGLGGHELDAPFCATSVTAMSSLVGLEAKLISHVAKLLDLATGSGDIDRGRISSLKRHLDSINQSHEVAKEPSSGIVHPIRGFRYIRRLLHDWRRMTMVNQSSQSYGGPNRLEANLKSVREVISKWRVWPKESDQEAAALALIRIGHTYQLHPSLAMSSTCCEHYQYPEHHHDHNYHNHDQSCVSAKSSRNVPISIQLLKASLIPKNCNNAPGACHLNYNQVTPVDNCYFPGKSRVLLDDPRSLNQCHVQGHHKDILTLDDVMLLTKTAIDHHYLSQARHWLSVTSSIINQTMGSCDASLRAELALLEKKLNKMAVASLKPEIVSEDEVTDNYFRLCRRSIERPHPRHASTANDCSWRTVWPYVRHKMETLHKSPDVYRFYDVISGSEIEHFKSQSLGKLFPSKLDDLVSNGRKSLEWRSSHTAWLGDQTPKLLSVSHRVGQVVGLVTTPQSRHHNVTTDVMTSEPWQVVNYGLGGMYGPHLDTLFKSHHHNDEAGGDRFRSAGDRIATWMFYLNDVSLGGATVFPLLDTYIKPIKGSAILWYNLRHDGQPDPRTVHAGCPVVEGDKWVANKWIRETAQWNTRPCQLKA